MEVRRSRVVRAVFVPMILVMAACATHAEAPAEPMIRVDPMRGATGATVLVTASGFQPGQAVEIGFGPPASEYHVIAETSAGSHGRVAQRVRVPTWADEGRSYVFVVAEAVDEPGRLKLISDPFEVER